MEKKTYHQVIDETVEYYLNNPRSVGVDGLCLYNGPNGEKCAFSRCCEPDSQFNEGWPASSSGHMNNLRAEYKHLNIPDFWNSLQELHDKEEYWTEPNHVENRERFVLHLKSLYNE